MPRFTRLLFLVCCILVSLFATTKGQAVIQTEGFETDGEGTRYTSNHYLLSSPTCDFFERMPAAPLDACFQTNFFSNFQGNFFWGAEDIQRSGVNIAPGQLTLNSINIAGYTGLSVSLYLATANNNGLRWESADSINIQASINGGAFRTVGRFMGDSPTGGNLIRDNNLNGAFDVGEPIVSVNPFTQYTFNITGTGTTLQIRIDCDQIGGSEELGFDLIEVRGTAPTCTPPTISCPGTQSLALNAFCQATLADYTSLATVTGNCSPVVTQSPAAGTTVSGSGAMTVSLFATNTALQSATCTFTVNKTTPEVEVRGNANVIADGDATPSTTDHTDFGSVLTCTGTIVRTYTINNLSGAFARTLNVGTVTVGGTNASDFTVTAQPASTVAVGGSTTFNVTFNPSANGLRSATLSFTTDDCDENPYNFSIQGTGNADVVDPTVICPATQTLTLDGNCQASLGNYIPLATITDNCPGAPTTGQSPAAGTTQSGTGAITVSIFATDGSLNSNTCTFTVNKVDNTAPSITCPSTITQAVGSGVCTATVTYTTPSGTDNCAGVNTTQTAGLASGASFPVGTTTNTFRATDASGNSITCTFNVTVFDGQAPSISCPSNITQSVASGTCAATVTYSTPTGTDNCSGANTTQTAGLPSGASYPVGVTTNTFNVTDASSNTASCTFTVTVTDNEAPSLTCPPSSTVPQNPGTCVGPINFTLPTASDNCSGATVTQTFGPTSGSTGPVGGNSIILQATDASGNTTTCVFIIDVLDTELPTITCPNNVTGFTLPDSCYNYINYPAPTASDNCAIAQITVVTGSASGFPFFSGVTNVTLLASDMSSNVTTCLFTVTVVDSSAPDAICQAADVFLDANGNGSLNGSDIDGGSTDNCGIASVSAAPNTFTASNLGANNVVLTVTDVNGNTSTCTAVVTVFDTITALTDRIIPGINMEAAPNPFHDILVLKVTCDGCEVGGMLTVELWNLTGQRLMRQTMPADLGMSTLRLPTGQLAAGTYLVSLTDGKGFISRRVVKQ